MMSSLVLWLCLCVWAGCQVLAVAGELIDWMSQNVDKLACQNRSPQMILGLRV